MKKEHLQELEDEITLFETQTQKFLNKELSVKEFKGFSGGFGSYAQRGAQLFMLRLRMDQGVVSKDKLAFLCDTCKQYHVHKAHITTCQTIQLHDLDGTSVPKIMKEALHHGIITRGGGGDFPRNVMCSPLSGIDPKEPFDVLPYAKATGEYLLSIVNKYSLPRKLKVAFSNSEQNETHANFRDLGFVALPDHTFDVYCAGGLGNHPKMGVKVGSHVPLKDILYYVSTMVLFFMEHGNYENRAKARSRYIQEVLGIEGIQQDFQSKVEKAMLGQQHDLIIEENLIQKTGVPFSCLPQRVIAQKQKGLYAVSYHPIGGTLSSQTLNALYEAIKDMDDVCIRLTPQQGMYIINLNQEEVHRVLSLTQDGAQNLWESSVACIGASTCQVGLRDSQAALQQAITYLREEHIDTQYLPRCFFSGCPSSCGTNQIGAIGFQGSVKLVDQKPQPAFRVSVLGKEAFSDTMFGRDAGLLLESDLALFLKQLAIETSKHALPFETWVCQYPKEFQDILTQYTA